MYKQMRYHEWAEKYKPVLFSIEGEVFPEQPKEFEHNELKNYNPLCVWTALSGSDWDEIHSGWHYVNRTAYHITEIPIEQGEEIIVIVETPEEYLESWGACADCGQQNCTCFAEDED